MTSALVIDIALAGAVACVIVIGVLVPEHKRDDHPARPTVTINPPTMVRILEGEDELREALERAAHFEHVIAMRAEKRANLYEAQISLPRAGDVVAGHALPDQKDRHAHPDAA